MPLYGSKTLSAFGGSKKTSSIGINFSKGKPPLQIVQQALLPLAEAESIK